MIRWSVTIQFFYRPKLKIGNTLGGPEEGVLKTGFALVTLKTPVCFGDEDNDPLKKIQIASTLPMRQVALDNQSMDDAYRTTRLIANGVDIIEVGTILCAVRDLKALYPDRIVLADWG